MLGYFQSLLHECLKPIFIYLAGIADVATADGITFALHIILLAVRAVPDEVWPFPGAVLAKLSHVVQQSLEVITGTDTVSLVLSQEVSAAETMTLKGNVVFPMHP